MTKKKWKKRWVVIPVLLVFVLAAVCMIYVNDYYHSEVKVGQFLYDERIKTEEIAEGIYLDGPGEDSALVFYPGAKVEYTAYLPLLYRFAGEGVDCFLIRMPCNLAFLGQNRAEDIQNTYGYEHWYLAGHSLGGAMAASYAAEHPGALDGLVLLAAYPTKSLQSQDLSVLSVYGSEDGVLNMQKVESGRAWMPSDYTEICIEGGNHASFGDYGEQDGDRPAQIDRREQQAQTADAILEVVGSREKKTSGEERMTYRQITAEEAKEIMEKDGNCLILDVRTQEEYDGGHIRGAVCLPNEEILGKPEELPDQTQTILVYCRSGNRSKQAAQKLAEMGYENILEFGGITDWPYRDLVE